MPNLGPTELLIILIIVLLVFFFFRVSKLGSELGKGISAFRQGLREGQEELEAKKEQNENSTEE